MSPRLRLAFLVTAILALGAIAGVLAFALGDRAAGTVNFEGALRPPGIPPVPFGLRDQNGRPVRLADLRGRPAVVTFQYTTCRDTCPVTTAQIRGALDQLGHDVPVIAVSVDPRRDTPASARAYTTKQHMDGRMRWALGRRAQLSRVWRAFGVQPQSARSEHSASTVLLDARGRQRVGFFTDALTPEALAHDIRMLERERTAGASGA
ncbi:MAG: SCO family protein [Actinomycetota bacterium]|nr:SCO family protein [Actinomycetota bacterium]